MTREDIDVQMVGNMTRMWLRVYVVENPGGTANAIMLLPDPSNPGGYAEMLIPVWDSEVSFGIN